VKRANPESITTLALAACRIRERRKEGALGFSEVREWPKGQARREYGFRACAQEGASSDVQLHIEGMADLIKNRFGAWRFEWL
jgi:hypothetical protein